MCKKISPLKKRLYVLVLACLVPLVVMIIYLLITLNRFSDRYDAIVSNITMANTYNINFKEDMDYIMYIIAVNAERAEELVDMEQPHIMIDDARQMFQKLYKITEEENSKNQLKRIVKNLNTLEDRVEEIEEDAYVIGTYDLNMERLDVNIRILTNIIQEQIQTYIYYQTTNLDMLRGDIRTDVNRAIQIASVIFIVILTAAFFISQKIVLGITRPIQNLCEVTKVAGSGDFGVRAKEESGDELVLLSISFNHMVEQIGNLVEDIRIEQMNLKATELKLLQAQINPHFLYNTLDAIIWLAESGEKNQVVFMVSALSDFFRTTLSKGRDFVSVSEEEVHIKSYLKIQQFRYQDILEYDIQIPEELHEYQILKMTLQPLVENALYHGIKNKRRLGHIQVKGRKENDTLVFQIYDDGMGIRPEKLEYIKKVISGDIQDHDNPSGFGLFNVEQRVRLNYGARYGIRINSAYREWTEVTVTIPAVKK